MKKLALVSLIFIFLSGAGYISEIESELEGRWIGVTETDQKVIMIFKKNNEVSIDIIEENRSIIIQGIYSIYGSSNPYNIDIGLQRVDGLTNHKVISTIISVNGRFLTMENNEPGKLRPRSFKRFIKFMKQ